MKPTVLTIGVFDGVHIGHADIIRRTIRRAKALGLKNTVVTFDPHPLKILRARSKIPSLISLRHRLRLISSLGVDSIAVIKFTKELSKVTPEGFVKDILIDGLGMKEIFVSDNFYFGRGAKAGTARLKELAREFGFKANIIKPVRSGGKAISSSRIRSLITGGRLERAADLLGRPVSVLGTVVHGVKRGRKLGFPTANIDPHHEVIPPSGVYAVRVILNGKAFKGILNIGSRPTFPKSLDSSEFTIEAHIFGFDTKIYGREIEIIFVKRLRDERRFWDEAHLARQIARDMARARRALA
jgi:riboflavin kinase/FMN adenylyltransferase